MKIGVIAACRQEIDPFIQKIEGAVVTRAAMLDIVEGTFAGVPVAAVCCGIGKVNAALASQLVIDRFFVTHLVMTGVAGGMDRRPKICDTVIATDVAHHDLALSLLTEGHPFHPDGVFHSDEALVSRVRRLEEAGRFSQAMFYGLSVTGEIFIDQEGRREINERFGPLAVDMESAAVAQVCHANGIPLLVIRSISDVEDESGISVFEQYSAAAGLRSLDVVEALIRDLSQSGM